MNYLLFNPFFSCFFLRKIIVERLKECLITIILLLVVEILYQEVLWKMCWELVFHMRDSFTEDTTLESQLVISQHFSFHFLGHFFFLFCFKIQPVKWSPQLLDFDIFILYLYLFIQFPNSCNNNHCCCHKQASHSATICKQSSPTFLVTFSRLRKKAKAYTEVIKQWILYPEFFLLKSSS